MNTIQSKILSGKINEVMNYFLETIPHQHYQGFKPWSLNGINAQDCEIVLNLKSVPFFELITLKFNPPKSFTNKEHLDEFGAYLLDLLHTKLEELLNAPI